MNTPNIDAVCREAEALKHQITYLKLAHDKLTLELAKRPSWDTVDEARSREAEARTRADKLTVELAQKQESWDKAANYRDRVFELVKQCDEKSARIKTLYEEREHFKRKLAEIKRLIP